MHLEMSVSKILAHDHRHLMVLQNYQSFIEMTSNIIYIVAHGSGLKCPHKMHFGFEHTVPFFPCFGITEGNFSTFI